VIVALGIFERAVSKSVAEEIWWAAFRVDGATVPMPGLALCRQPPRFRYATRRDDVDAVLVGRLHATGGDTCIVPATEVDLRVAHPAPLSNPSP
jgi:hypothetical protein